MPVVMSLHDNAAVLLKRPQDLGKILSNHLRHIVLLVLLMMLSTMLLLVWSPPLRTSTLRLWRAMSSLVSGLMMPILMPSSLRLIRITALQVNKNSPRIFLRPILQPKLIAKLLDLGLQLLHMTRRVIALAYNDMKMMLSPGLIRPNSLLNNALRLLYKLSVQVDLIGLDTTGGIVLTEDKV